MIIFAMAVAGGVGAVLRFIVDTDIRKRTAGAFPWGTLAINAVGSLMLGFVVGSDPPRAELLILGTGFFGGFTTFSTASVETVRLALAGTRSVAIWSLFLMVLSTAVTAWVGLTLAQL